MPEKSDKQIKEEFLTPRSKYQGEFTPQTLAFNANLQEFAQRIGLICGLETGGKISSADAYKDIKKLWKELKASKKSLLKSAEQPKSDLE
jgi:hypothetical protein